MPHQTSHCYEFGPYRFDVDQRVLTRTGEAVSLTPKATDVLMLLVTNAGQLVAKDELLKQVWPDTFVEESNLTQNIFLLRRVLGDERPSPRYIETVVRRGYRFIANVRVIGLEDPRDPWSTIPTSSVSSHAANGEPTSAATVAVLPFLNMTGNQDVEYLADGLTDNIVNNLSRVSKLRVMSRSAVFRYKTKKELDPRAVGRELGVSVVLVGKLTSQPVGNLNSGTQDLGISVELVEVTTGWQLWGDTFDCHSTDILEIQDLITRQLLTALKLNLTGDEEKRITARYTESGEAYQSYLEARYHWSKYTRQGIERAITHFRHAIELDPNYALAYAGIIDCYLRLATNYLPPEDDLVQPPPNELPLPETDEKQESRIGDAHPKVKLRFEWDWKAAERELLRATDLKIDYPSAHQWYAAYRVVKDLFKESTRSHDCKLPAQIIFGAPTRAEEIQVLCAVAREQIAVGNFDAAELILKSWYSEEAWPNLDSLAPHAAADLLFTLGLLIGSLAGTKRMVNGNKRAEAFLSGSIALFKNLGTRSRSAEALVALGRCYYQEGQFDIARQSFSASFSELPDAQQEIKCLCLIYWAALERTSGRLMDSLSKLRDAANLHVAGLSVWGRCHLELATTLKDLAACEDQESYNDEAQLHYRSALYESEAIGNHRMVAIVENNLGFLLLNLALTDESESRLLRARRYFEALADSIRQAQVNETLTRLYIRTNRYSLAQETIEDALQTLELTDGEAVLSEALTTSGIVACRLERFADAQRRFESAYKVAERCGDREGARRALVSMFKEMKERLGHTELRQILDKLQRLQLITEPSPLAGRVEETVTEIAAVLRKDNG